MFQFIPEEIRIILLFVFFLGSSVMIFIFYQNEKWKASKKMLNKIKEEKFQVFKKLIVQTNIIPPYTSLSMGDLNSRKNLCNIYINKCFIVIVLAQRPSVFYINYYPVIFEKGKNEPNHFIKNEWNSISIHTKYKLILSGSGDLKLFIKTKNEQEKHALYEALNNWKQASILSHKKADTP